jgi:hypothetical protein
MGFGTRFVVAVPNLIEQSLAIFFGCYHDISSFVSRTDGHLGRPCVLQDRPETLCVVWIVGTHISMMREPYIDALSDDLRNRFIDFFTKTSAR